MGEGRIDRRHSMKPGEVYAEVALTMYDEMLLVPNRREPQKPEGAQNQSSRDTSPTHKHIMPVLQ